MDGFREVNYSYDALGRLSAAATTGVGTSFAYDGFGNKTGQTVTKGSGPAMSVAMDGNNRIVGHSYDAAGNTTAANGMTMTWDAMGRMTGVPSASESYSYNPGNARIYKKTGQSELLYIRGTDGMVREVRSVSNGVIGAVVQGPTVRIAGRKVGDRKSVV